MEIGPVMDLGCTIPQLGTGHCVVHWQVFLGEVTEPLQVDEHVRAVPVHRGDLNVSLEIP